MNAIIDRYVSEFSGSFDMAVLLWPLLSLLLCLPFLVYLYRRDGWLRLTTIFAIYASILYAAGLVCFTLYPLPTGDAGPGITYGIPPILNPLNFIDDIARGGAHAVLQLLFNIVLFVPLGFIARTLLNMKLPMTFAVSLAATCLIETAQLTGLFGAYPYAFRTFDVDDLICNTLGGVIGWGLGHAASRLTMRGSAVVPPITRNPGFIRRSVALLTDFMIIDVCCIVPRLVLLVGLRVMFGDALFDDEAALERFNRVSAAICFVAAFAVVEVIVPWRTGGSTPAGMFYRMSCETEERTGRDRAAFYALRTPTVFLILLFPRYLVLPFALFYLIAKKMPYDLVPSSGSTPTALASPEAE